MPDSFEMRPISSTGKPNRYAARARVTYFGISSFMVAPSGWNHRHSVFFDRQNHRFINVYVPTVADPHPDRFCALFKELSAKGDFDITQRNLQNHRVSQPTVVSRLHGVP